jgi:hypothetical protein
LEIAAQHLPTLFAPAATLVVDRHMPVIESIALNVINSAHGRFPQPFDC